MSAPEVDLYAVLGVRVDAPADEVRRAYLRLAREHHPDFHAGDQPEERAAAADRMRAVNEAWAVLGDPARRQRYDRERQRAARGGPDPGFVPFDDDDEPDPRLAPDVPYAPPIGGRARRVLAVAPALCLGLAVVLGAVGSIVRIPPLVAVAAVLLVLGVLGFVILPLLALSEARRHG